MSPPLPPPHHVQRVDQHQDVQREVVANAVRQGELNHDREEDRQPYRPPRGHRKSADHRHDVRQRVDDTVAVVIERDRRVAATVDDEVGVLDDLPRGLDEHRQDKPGGNTPPTADQPKQQVEGKPMNDVGERVPIRQVLRILGALHEAVPQLDASALADRHASHCGEDGSCGCDDRSRQHDSGGVRAAKPTHERRDGTIFLAFISSRCRVVGGTFKAGFWSGIIVVTLIAIALAFLASKGAAEAQIVRDDPWDGYVDPWRTCYIFEAARPTIGTLIFWPPNCLSYIDPSFPGPRRRVVMQRRHDRRRVYGHPVPPLWMRSD